MNKLSNWIKQYQIIAFVLIAFTCKPAGEGYLLTTNFNLAISEKGPVDFRWDTATSMLDTLGDSQVSTPEFTGEILKAIHLKTLTTHTLQSNVIDLKDGDIYYMSQYDEAVKLNFAEGLAKGQRVIEARSQFPKKMAEARDASDHSFETRFRVAQVTVILIGLGLITLGFPIVTQKSRREKGNSL